MGTPIRPEGTVRGQPYQTPVSDHPDNQAEREPGNRAPDLLFQEHRQSPRQVVSGIDGLLPPTT